MFGKLGDMGAMMKKAMEVKTEMTRVKKEIAETEITGRFAESVEVVVSGDMKVKSINISDAALSGNKEDLQSAVMCATNDALESAQKMSAQKIAKVTDSIGIPGLSNLLS